MDSPSANERGGVLTPVACARQTTAGGTFTFDQAGADVATHAADGVMRVAPTVAGSFSFTVQARDGAKQVATALVSVVVE